VLVKNSLNFLDIDHVLKLFRLVPRIAHFWFQTWSFVDFSKRFILLKKEFNLKLFEDILGNFFHQDFILGPEGNKLIGCGIFVKLVFSLKVAVKRNIVTRSHSDPDNVSCGQISAFSEVQRSPRKVVIVAF
jgi:hypothetical protein